MKAQSSLGIIGIVTLELLDSEGNLKQRQVIRNKITDAGDQYIIRKLVAAIAPVNAAAPTAASGMKLGTGVTAASKSGAGAALGSYITGSQQLFAATYPVVAAVGTDVGWKATFRSTWGAGVATNAAITEVALVNDAAANATSTAANTYSRSVFSSVNKGASDILNVTWDWIGLGA